MMAEISNMLWQSAGAPGDGTDNIQTLTLSAAPVAGSFRLKFGPGAQDSAAVKSEAGDAPITPVLPYNATAAEVQAALCALPTIGLGGCSVGLQGQVYTVTFTNGMGRRALPLIIHVAWTGANDLTDAGGNAITITAAHSQAGVTAFGIGAPKGALCIDTVNAQLYQNGGTAAAPAWALVGLQA